MTYEGLPWKKSQSLHELFSAFLGQLNLAEDSSGNKKLPKERSFTYFNKVLNRKDDEVFTGIQANEAPVKALLKVAHQSDADVTEISYLLSNACAEPVIPASAVANLTAFAGCDEKFFSVDSFFEKRIKEYCTEKGYRIPEFIPIPYAPSRPADSLGWINAYLDKEYEVAIDITGGRRDAVLLEALTIQLLKFKKSDNALKALVYASYEDKHIIDQKPTFDLISLVNAIDAFSRYGKTEQLYDFFITNRYNWEHVTPETRNLLGCMNEFSNALALCQVGDIDKKVQKVQNALQKARNRLDEKSEGFNVLNDTITAIDTPDNWWLSGLSFEELLQRIEDAQIPVDVSVPADEDLKNRLSEQRKSYITIRSELILHFLIPTIQDRFIPETHDKTMLIFNIIKWCVNHQMIQQALAIFQENISECLIASGYFEEAERLEQNSKEQDIITRLAANCLPQKSVDGNYLIFSENDSVNRANYDSYFTMKRKEEAPDAIAWCHYLRGRRNQVMHAAPAPEAKYFLFACKYLGKNASEPPTIDSLANDLADALNCFDQPQQVNAEKWNAVYREVYGASEEIPIAPATAGKSTANNASARVARFGSEDLLGWLDEFSETKALSGRVNFKDFNEWCVTQGKPFSKASFGLAPKKPFCQEICSKYPDTFSYEVVDGVPFLDYKTKN